MEKKKITNKVLWIFAVGQLGWSMLSGIVEMVMRVGVIIIFIKRAGFMATSFAEIAAWTGALTMNVCAYFYITHKKLGMRSAKIKQHGPAKAYS